MLALEISVNGHHIQTISAGEMGMLTAHLMAHRIVRRDGSVAEDLWLHPSGIDDGTGDHVEWVNSYLKVGDTVSIRIVETDIPGDQPFDRLSSDELERRRQERRNDPD